MDRPILFSAPMVRAILEGRKTQTRRIVNLDTLRARLPYTVKSDCAGLLPGTSIKAKPGSYRAAMNAQGAVSINVGATMLGLRPGEFDLSCPYADGTTRLVEGRWHIEPRESRLWVRETHTFCPKSPRMERWSHTPEEARVLYAADGDVALSGPHGIWSPKWRPSIHMPRWASRTTLDVLSVRVERLQDISEEDARAEGVVASETTDGRGSFVRVTAREAFSDLWRTINGPESWDANLWVWVVTFKRAAEVPRAA